MVAGVNTPGAWPEEDFARAVALLRAGKTPKQIAEEIGRPVGALRSKLTRAGIWMKPRWTAEQDRILRENPSLTATQLEPLIAAAGPARPARQINGRRSRLGVVIVPVTETHARAMRSARTAAEKRIPKPKSARPADEGEGVDDSELVARCRAQGGFPVRVLVNGAPVEIYPARIAA